MLRIRPSKGTLLRLSALGLLFAISCGGGSCGGSSGCGGCSDGTYDFPEDDPSRPDAVVQDEVLRVRVTQDFLDFIKPQLPEIIVQQFANQGGGFYVDMDNVLHIPLPDVDAFDIGIAGARLRNSEALLWLDDLEGAVDVQFETPDTVRLTIDRMRLGIDARIKEDVAGTTSSCPVEGDLGPLNPGELKHAAEISVEATINPGVGPEPDYDLDIQVDIDDIALDDLALDVVGSSVYCQEPECQDCLVEPFGTCLDPGGRCAECHVFCGGLTNLLLDLVGALIDLIRPLLNQILRPVVEGLLGDALNDLNGSSAKIEQQVNLGELAGLPFLDRANPLGVLAAPTPGRFPVVDRGMGNGMEITVNAGAEGELADCIGDIDDFIPNPGPVPEPAGADMMGRPYHVWTTFSASYLNQVLYALHRSGTLCVELGSEDVRELTGGAFQLNASLLTILASDIGELANDRAPVILQLKPRTPGRVELGSGELIGQDDEGNDLYDWLLKLTLEDIGVAFHVFMHDRYVRVFEVTADVFVGLNVTVLPDNRLEVALGELRIDDFTETFNEILPNADFAEVLPTLLDIALGAVLNQSLTFDFEITDAVSDALGGAPIYLRVNEIFRDGVQEDYLTMTLTFTSSRAGGNLMLAADTRAGLHPTEDGLVERNLDGEREATGRVRLSVGDGLPYDEQRALEYQVRVDGGLWRIPRPANPDGTLFVEDAKLKIPGTHEIEVRARYTGDYQSLDPTPAIVEARVDPFPPKIRAKLGDAGINVEVWDVETVDPEGLRVQMRLDDGAWTPVSMLPGVNGACATVIDYARVKGADRVSLRAFDESDNVSRVRTISIPLVLDHAAPDATAEDGAGCACHDAGVPHGHGEWPAVLFGLLVGALVYRVARRR